MPLRTFGDTQPRDLPHDLPTTTWRNLFFHGTAVDEVRINAARCGQHGVPVLLVTGDAAVCRESRELLGPELHTVAVKQGLPRDSARQVPPRARP